MYNHQHVAEQALGQGSKGLLKEPRPPATGVRTCQDAAPFHHSDLWCTLQIRFSSVAQLCPTLCDPMNHSTPGLPVHHQLLEFTQTHVHRVGDAI